MKAPARTMYASVYLIPEYDGHQQFICNASATPRDPNKEDSLVSDHQWVFVRDLAIELPEVEIDDNEAVQAELAALDIKERKIRAEMMSDITQIDERRQSLLALTFTPE